MCLLGFILALFWFLVMRASYFWIVQWRKRAAEIDEASSRFKAFAQMHEKAEESSLRSPVVITKYLPLLVFMPGWIALAVVIWLGL
jgi:hypothetical protein